MRPVASSPYDMSMFRGGPPVAGGGVFDPRRAAVPTAGKRAVVRIIRPRDEALLQASDRGGATGVEPSGGPLLNSLPPNLCDVWHPATAGTGFQLGEAMGAAMAQGSGVFLVECGYAEASPMPNIDTLAHYIRPGPYTSLALGKEGRPGHRLGAGAGPHDGPGMAGAFMAKLLADSNAPVLFSFFAMAEIDRPVTDLLLPFVSVGDAHRAASTLDEARSGTLTAVEVRDVAQLSTMTASIFASAAMRSARQRLSYGFVFRCGHVTHVMLVLHEDHQAPAVAVLEGRHDLLPDDVVAAMRELDGANNRMSAGAASVGSLHANLPGAGAVQGGPLDFGSGVRLQQPTLPLNGAPSVPPLLMHYGPERQRIAASRLLAANVLAQVRRVMALYHAQSHMAEFFRPMYVVRFSREQRTDPLGMLEFLRARCVGHGAGPMMRDASDWRPSGASRLPTLRLPHRSATDHHSHNGDRDGTFSSAAGPSTPDRTPMVLVRAAPTPSRAHTEHTDPPDFEVVYQEPGESIDESLFRESLGTVATAAVSAAGAKPFTVTGSTPKDTVAYLTSEIHVCRNAQAELEKDMHDVCASTEQLVKRHLSGREALAGLKTELQKARDDVGESSRRTEQLRMALSDAEAEVKAAEAALRDGSRSPRSPRRADNPLLARMEEERAAKMLAHRERLVAAREKHRASCAELAATARVRRQALEEELATLRREAAAKASRGRRELIGLDAELHTSTDAAKELAQELQLLHQTTDERRRKRADLEAQVARLRGLSSDLDASASQIQRLGCTMDRSAASMASVEAEIKRLQESLAEGRRPLTRPVKGLPNEAGKAALDAAIDGNTLTSLRDSLAESKHAHTTLCKKVSLRRARLMRQQLNRAEAEEAASRAALGRQRAAGLVLLLSDHHKERDAVMRGVFEQLSHGTGPRARATSVAAGGLQVPARCYAVEQELVAADVRCAALHKEVQVKARRRLELASACDTLMHENAVTSDDPDLVDLEAACVAEMQAIGKLREAQRELFAVAEEELQRARRVYMTTFMEFAPQVERELAVLEAIAAAEGRWRAGDAAGVADRHTAATRSRRSSVSSEPRYLSTTEASRQRSQNGPKRGPSTATAASDADASCTAAAPLASHGSGRTERDYAAIAMRHVRQAHTRKGLNPASVNAQAVVVAEAGEGICHTYLNLRRAVDGLEALQAEVRGAVAAVQAEEAQLEATTARIQQTRQRVGVAAAESSRCSEMRSAVMQSIDASRRNRDAKDEADSTAFSAHDASHHDATADLREGLVQLEAEADAIEAAVAMRSGDIRRIAQELEGTAEEAGQLPDLQRKLAALRTANAVTASALVAEDHAHNRQDVPSPPPKEKRAAPARLSVLLQRLEDSEADADRSRAATESFLLSRLNMVSALSPVRAGRGPSSSPAPNPRGTPSHMAPLPRYTDPSPSPFTSKYAELRQVLTAHIADLSSTMAH